MEIKRLNSIITNTPLKKASKQESMSVPEQKSAKASSLSALGNYGLAMVNIKKNFPSEQKTVLGGISDTLSRVDKNVLDEFSGLFGKNSEVNIENIVNCGLKSEFIKKDEQGNVNLKSLTNFLLIYDKEFYKKLDYIENNFPDLDKSGIRKISSAYKTVEKMELHSEDIKKWSESVPKLYDFAHKIQEEGRQDTENTKIKIANALGVKPEDINVRAKGLESTYDKLARKLLNGKEIENLNQAKPMVDDLVGTRLVMDDVSQENIDKLVDNLCNSILNHEIQITEIHNYSNNSQKYLSENNIKSILKANALANKDLEAKGLKGVEIKINKDEQISLSGYVSAQMNIRYKDENGNLGARGELQIRGNIMNKYGEIEHIPYDIRRGKNIGKNNTELEKHFEPVEHAVHKLKRNGLDKVYDNYILECYKYLRDYELGKTKSEFKLPDFPQEIKEYEILSFESLDRINEKAHEIKKRNNLG